MSWQKLQGLAYNLAPFTIDMLVTRLLTSSSWSLILALLVGPVEGVMTSDYRSRV